MGAWIEITSDMIPSPANIVAPLVGAWIEIILRLPAFLTLQVAPLVGAWIEISMGLTEVDLTKGRSPRGSVD